MKNTFIILLLFLSSIMFGQIPRAPFHSARALVTAPEPGTSALLTNLVAYFDFNEISGVLTNKVSSNNGTAGTGVSYNQTAMNAEFGTCLSFNGATTAAITLPDVVDFQFNNSSVTMGCWFYSTGSNQQGIFGGETGSVALDIAPPGYFLGNTGVNAYQFGTITYTANQWNFIAVTFDANSTTNNATLYVNGSTVTRTAVFNPASGSSTNLIGADAPGSAPFSGRIDEVFIYKGRVLTITELDELYNNGNGIAYPFDGTAPVDPAPTFVSAELGTYNDSIVTVRFSEALNSSSVPAITDFTVWEDTTPFGIEAVRLSADSVYIALDSTGQYGAAYALDYTSGVNPLQDNVLSNVANFTGRTITNNIPYNGPANEKVTNGDFSNGFTGWTRSEEAGSIVNGAFQCPIINNFRLFQTPSSMISPMEVSTNYRISFTVLNVGTSGSSIGLRFTIMDNGASLNYVESALYGNGNYSIDFTTPAVIPYNAYGFMFYFHWDQSGGQLDNISITER